ncbi:hypothetical protein [Haladaptatus sp. DYF46]|uniref:hypothetical protein n=1 Tax=Haladaptatus sp. DYF46 TaxID=2886041 RepID=UPI001E32718E|nr:hypothetical protein [Haladaptatus sp. DYF46]
MRLLSSERRHTRTESKVFAVLFVVGVRSVSRTIYWSPPSIRRFRGARREHNGRYRGHIAPSDCDPPSAYIGV